MILCNRLLVSFTNVNMGFSYKRTNVRTVIFIFGDGKDENAITSEGWYGISIELIFCLKYPPNVAI